MLPEEVDGARLRLTMERPAQWRAYLHNLDFLLEHAPQFLPDVSFGPNGGLQMADEERRRAFSKLYYSINIKAATFIAAERREIL